MSRGHYTLLWTENYELQLQDLWHNTQEVSPEHISLYVKMITKRLINNVVFLKTGSKSADLVTMIYR
jgi:hypothetical protein